MKESSNFEKDALSVSDARWYETIRAIESMQLGKVVDGDKVHAWLKSWGTADELSQYEKISNTIHNER